jgi:hypothetical protein
MNPESFFYRWLYWNGTDEQVFRLAIGFAISADGESWRLHIAAPAGLQQWFHLNGVQTAPGLKDWLLYWHEKQTPVASHELSAMFRVMHGPLSWASVGTILADSEHHAGVLLSGSLLIPIHPQKQRREKRPQSFRRRLQRSPLAGQVTFDFQISAEKYNLVAPVTLDAACLNHVGHYAKSYTSGEKASAENAFQHALYVVDALSRIHDVQKNDRCYVIEDPSMLSKTASEIRPAVDMRCKERGLIFIPSNGIDGLIQTWLEYPVRPMVV